MRGRVQAPTAKWQAPPSNLALCEVGDVRVPIKQQTSRPICLASWQFRALMLPEQRRPMHQLSDGSAALAAFIARKTEIDTILARLAALSADHFNRSPDEITWADVGTLGSHLERLREVS